MFLKAAALSMAVVPIPGFLSDATHSGQDLFVAWADAYLSIAVAYDCLHAPTRYKILNKDPASKAVTKTDKFTVNRKFTNVARRLKVCRTCCGPPGCGSVRPADCLINAVPGLLHHANLVSW